MDVDIAVWYEKYGPMVIRRCRSILHNEEEAMDAVQDVFVNLIRWKKRLQGQYPSSLLYTMATNTCLNRLRNRKRETPDDFALRDEAVTEEGYGQTEAEVLTEAILKDESEKTRLICFMYHADGMTLREIGGAVGLSVSGVRKRLETFKARVHLKFGEVGI
ncbi:MAG: sigma-70 family RNA polymerase sigma factor [Treponema sp.]|nr:sigma-70 family RNA polymerase sigma factor [Treponema sp.]